MEQNLFGFAIPLSLRKGNKLKDICDKESKYWMDGLWHENDENELEEMEKLFDILDANIPIYK